MNEQSPANMEPEDEKIAQKLRQVAQQTHVNAQFATELEERVRSARQAKPGWLATAFQQVSPALRLAFLLIVLGVALSWSIRTLIPAPQPATNTTPAVLNTVTPTSGAVITDQTATPFVPEEGGYTWRGTHLYLATRLPESPAAANVFMIQPEQPATIESVRALADQFGMQGEVFEAELEPNASSAFSVVDGDQRLNVRSDRYFEYIPDATKLGAEAQFSTRNPNAEAIIDEFMRSHKFDFPYTVERSELYQGFYVQAVTPDGLPLHHEFFGQNGLLFRLNDTQIISVSASLLQYDQVGTYKIKTAEEAFQQVVASTDFNGMIEGMHSSSELPQVWKRDYPVNETVTVYGWLLANQSVNGQELLVSIDGFPAKGDLAGIEKLGRITLVKTTGQFKLENDQKIFNVGSWEIYSRDDHGFSGKDAFPGTLQKQGENVVIVSEMGTFILPDVPADIPLPLENAYVYGVALGDVFEWEGIEHRETGEGGGGGGSNGTGFYKLNLSGSPVPFPSPTALSQINPGSGNYMVQEGETCADIAARFGISIQSIIDQNQLSENCVISVGQTLIIPGAATPAEDVIHIVQENETLTSIALNSGVTVDELRQWNGLVNDMFFVGQELIVQDPQTGQSIVGQHIQGAHGILIVTIYQNADGGQRTEYVLQPMSRNAPPFILNGADLQGLQAYHNLPVTVWGTVERIDQMGNMVLHVERYEIPFPDLRIQLFQGKQKITEVDGQQAILFTTEDGTTYVQMLTFDIPDTTTILGVEGDDVILEGRAIPGDSFGGYPTLHVLSGSMAVNPKDNQTTGMIVTADQPYIVEETGEFPGNELPNLPAATIEKVELVYYIPDSRYARLRDGSDAEYIQPAWRFYGHHSNGSEFEILIQALEQEFLIPELAPFTRPG